MSNVHLDLLISFDARTVDGDLRHDDGTVRRFHGWLGLFEALEQLRHAEQNDADRETP